MKGLLKTFANQETGQSIMEYALILFFIVFAVVGIAVGNFKSVSGVTTLTNQNLTAAALVIH